MLKKIIYIGFFSSILSNTTSASYTDDPYDNSIQHKTVTTPFSPADYANTAYDYASTLNNHAYVLSMAGKGFITGGTGLTLGLLTNAFRGFRPSKTMLLINAASYAGGYFLVKSGKMLMDARNFFVQSSNYEYQFRKATFTSEDLIREILHKDQ